MNSIETTTVVISVIIYIVILVCFFFLCSNVAQIKKQLKPHMNKDVDFDAQFKFFLAIGDKDKAKDLLYSRILSNEQIFSFKYGLTTQEKIQSCFEVYGEELTALGIEKPALTQE